MVVLQISIVCIFAALLNRDLNSSIRPCPLFVLSQSLHTAPPEKSESLSKAITARGPMPGLEELHDIKMHTYPGLVRAIRFLPALAMRDHFDVHFTSALLSNARDGLEAADIIPAESTTKQARLAFASRLHHSSRGAC
jgi:hypothetical protein